MTRSIQTSAVHVLEEGMQETPAVDNSRLHEQLRSTPVCLAGLRYEFGSPRSFLSQPAINLLRFRVDKTASIEGGEVRKKGSEAEDRYVVLELLSVCGMIFRARLRT